MILNFKGNVKSENIPGQTLLQSWTWKKLLGVRYRSGIQGSDK